MDIVTKVLDYYDKNYGKYDNFISNVKYYKHIYKTGDMERNILILYDKNKKEIFRSKVESIGSYYPPTKLWVWAWANPVNPKNNTYIVKKMFDYGMNMDPSKENLFLRTELITSRFRITESVKLDVYLALSSYLAKIPYVFKLFWYGEKQKKDIYYKYILDTEPHDKKLLFVQYIFLLDHDKLK